MMVIGILETGKNKIKINRTMRITNAAIPILGALGSCSFMDSYVNTAVPAIKPAINNIRMIIGAN